jgi:hypothetical protein
MKLISIDITISDDPKTFRINLLSTTSINNLFSRTKISFPDSIEIDDRVTPIYAGQSKNSIFRTIMIDSSDDFQNAFDSIQFNSCQE